MRGETLSARFPINVREVLRLIKVQWKVYWRRFFVFVRLRPLSSLISARGTCIIVESLFATNYKPLISQMRARDVLFLTAGDIIERDFLPLPSVSR